MADENGKKRNKYLKDKAGFKIESTDPVQDVMTDKELDEANQRILSLIDEGKNQKKS